MIAMINMTRIFLILIFHGGVIGANHLLQNIAISLLVTFTSYIKHDTNVTVVA